MEKEITLKFTNYEYEIAVDVTFGNGYMGTLRMNIRSITELTNKVIGAGISDRWPDVHCFNKVSIHIYANYEGYKIDVENRLYKHKDLIHAKVGI